MCCSPADVFALSELAASVGSCQKTSTTLRFPGCFLRDISNYASRWTAAMSSTKPRWGVGSCAAHATFSRARASRAPRYAAAGHQRDARVEELRKRMRHLRSEDCSEPREQRLRFALRCTTRPLQGIP